MQDVFPHTQTFRVTSRVSFDLSTCDGFMSFTLYRSPSNPFDGNEEQFIKFKSPDVFKIQIERLVRRVTQPRYRLTGVPWPRCWPPYKSAERDNAYFLGSLSGYSNSKRAIRRCLTFALLPDRKTEPIVCIDRFGENVFFLPEQVFHVILDSLEKDPSREQDATSNVGQRPIVNSGFTSRRG